MLFFFPIFNLGAPYQISQNSSSSRKQMKLSAFFSEKQNEIRHQGEQNNQNKDIEFQSSSAQEGSLCQSGEFESEVSLDNTELSKDSLSSDEHKASAFEERVSGDFAVDEVQAPQAAICLFCWRKVQLNLLVGHIQPLQTQILLKIISSTLDCTSLGHGGIGTESASQIY
jgi:hypothetical protein